MMEYLNTEWFGNELMSDETYNRRMEMKKAERNKVLSKEEMLILIKKNIDNMQKLFDSGYFYFSQIREMKDIDKYNMEYQLLDKLGEIEYKTIEEEFKVIETHKQNNDENYLNIDITVFLRSIIKLNIQKYLENVKLWLNDNNITDICKRRIYVEQAKYFWFHHNK